MEYPTYCCDLCQRQQEAVDGWFAVAAFNDLKFEVLPWAEAAEERLLSSREHICGQECLHKRLSQWLDLNSKTVPAPPEAA